MTGKEDLWRQDSDATVQTAELSDLKVLTVKHSSTTKIQPWQEELFKKMSQGWKAGEMVIISSGRQTGKSIVQDWLRMLDRNFIVETDALVDNEKWYTIRCNKKVATWVRKYPNRKHWDELSQFHNSNLFDIHESILIQLNLKFGS